MGRVHTALQGAKFIGGIYGNRILMAYWSRVRGDLFSRLNSPSDRTDPYEIYEQLRAMGPMVLTRLGNCSTTSHQLCNEVLRNRAFGVTPDDGSLDPVHQEGLDLSLLQVNPPDHTRLRRLASPASSPRRMAGHALLVDEAVARMLDAAGREREFDLMAAFASPLPIAGDDPAARTARGARTVEPSRRRAAGAVRHPALRLTEPGDDLISALIAEEGDSISASELGPLVRLLLLPVSARTAVTVG